MLAAGCCSSASRPSPAARSPRAVSRSPRSSSSSGRRLVPPTRAAHAPLTATTMQPATDDNRMPLVAFMACAALTWPGVRSLLDGADAAGDAAAADAAETPEQRVLRCGLLTSASLLQHRGLYLHLQAQLRDVMVLASIGKSSHKTSQISWLDPRAPPAIMMTNDEGETRTVEQDLQAKLAALPVSDEGAQQLAQLDYTLPCVGLMFSTDLCVQKSEPQRCFMTWPVELCRVIRKTKGSKEPKMRAAGYQLPGLKEHNPALAAQLSWLQQEGVDSLPPLVVAVLPSASAVAAAAPAAAADDDTASSSSTSDSAQEPASDSASGSSSAGNRLQEGFKSFISRLVPSKADAKHMRAVVDAVRQALRGVDSDTGRRWSVARVVSTGSFAKSTNLRRTAQHPGGDLDIVLLLRSYAGAEAFKACRGELLDAVARQLGQRDEGAQADNSRNWQLQPCHSNYFLRLYHPALQMQLDVQVAEWAGDTLELQSRVLAMLLASDPARSKSSRTRVTSLAELQAEVITSIDRRYWAQHGVTGYGRLFTDVVRLLKAWSNHGLKHALAAPAVSAGSAASSSQQPVLPPNYVWEVLTLHVLREQTQAGVRYKQHLPLQLFEDVLAAAEAQLRPGGAAEGAILATHYYTKARALTFSGCWGPERSLLHTPFIINPVDPTYNCTANTAFRDWAALADEAGALLARIRACAEASGEQGGAAAGGPWFAQLCATSSLGPAWEAFKP